MGLTVSLNKQPTISVGAQNVFDKACGAFTGETCASQLIDVGAKWTLTGHSERRTILGESDEFIAQKTKFALDNGVGVVLCIGETLEERKSGVTLDVCARQLDAVSRLSLTGPTLLLLTNQSGLSVPVWLLLQKMLKKPTKVSENIWPRPLVLNKLKRPESCTVVLPTVRMPQPSKTKPMLMVS